jgi:hypothetical protein
LPYAAEVFAICIRENMPSCILAPPEAQKITTGSFCLAALSKSRVTFSPTTDPMLAPINEKSMNPKSAGYPSILPWPVIIASLSPVACFAASILVSYPGNPRGSVVRRSSSYSTKLSSSRVMAILSLADNLK